MANSSLKTRKKLVTAGKSFTVDVAQGTSVVLLAPFRDAPGYKDLRSKLLGKDESAVSKERDLLIQTLTILANGMKASSVTPVIDGQLLIIDANADAVTTADLNYELQHWPIDGDKRPPPIVVNVNPPPRPPRERYFPSELGFYGGGLQIRDVLRNLPQRLIDIGERVLTRSPADGLR